MRQAMNGYKPLNSPYPLFIFPRPFDQAIADAYNSHVAVVNASVVGQNGVEEHLSTNVAGAMSGDSPTISSLHIFRKGILGRMM